MSDHTIKVAKLGSIESHPNADRLRIVRMDGFQSCAGGKVLEARPEDLAVFVPPQFVVREKNELFEKLSGVPTPCRIKTMKLRGVVSHGVVLYPLPEDWTEGMEVQEVLGITRYEPETHQSGGPNQPKGPPAGAVNAPFVSPKYDVESLRKYGDKLFEPGEQLVVTEKIHGCNGRFTYHDEHMWAGSRAHFYKPTEGNVWWRCLAQNPWIEDLCKAWPNHVFYGEVYGNVQDMRYGVTGDTLRFRIFDAYSKVEHKYEAPTSLEWLLSKHKVHRVPQLTTVEWGPNTIPILQELIDKTPSVCWEGGPAHYMEGCVVRPMTGPDVDRRGERRILKLVSFPYESNL